MKYFSILLGLAVFVMTGSMSHAQTRIDRSVVSSAAAKASSGTHIITATVGQPIIGTSKNSTQFAALGFWYRKENVAVMVERMIAPSPATATLEQNYPNPVQAMTVIRFSLPSAQSVRLILADEAGRTITDLVQGMFDAGSYQSTVDAGELPAGVYFYRLQAGGQVISRRMMVIH